MEFKKYICSVCGYVYDEMKGLKEQGIAPKTKWEDVPDDFLCPLCKAAKEAFEEQKDDSKKDVKVANQDFTKQANDELSLAEISVICSNYAKGFQKQYLPEQAALFNELADYFAKKSEDKKGDFDTLANMLDNDISENFPAATEQAKDDGDRGALRAVVWSEKVTKLLKSLIQQSKKNKDFAKDDFYVCEICGFVYKGDTPPEVCPVCKVPKFKINKV